MNNKDAVNVIENKGERLSFYQLFAEKDISIEIPIIQRDYAQGRDSVKEVRVTFLQALFAYLQEAKPFRDLDFVYGSIISSENGARNFIPLDGQQRLTTLFLLHWYLAQIAQKSESFREVLSKNGRSRFTYETRSSSREFCDALIANNIDFSALLEVVESENTGKESLAATIQDQSWFYLSWHNDPTIRSMLIMLDAIHQQFAHCPEYFDRLVDSEKPVITFLFLNLDKFGLTDDLYIKMNARGKPLTDFENFKARLEKKIKLEQSSHADYRLPFKPESVSAYEYFIHNIDTKWADFFWTYRNEATQDDTYDDELMNFIAQLIVNFQLLRTDSDSKRMSRHLLGKGGKLNRLSFMDYERLGCFSEGMLTYIISMFDLLQAPTEPAASKHPTPYPEKNSYYEEEETLKKILKNSSNYKEKLRFYAFYAGLESGKHDEELLSWMRVVFNLTENTIIDTSDDYLSALQSIKTLLEHKDSILEYLQQDVSVRAFTQAQVYEEKVKAHLLKKSPDWKSCILEVEAHAFFQGQIGFILKFSGIIGYYQEHKNMDWIDSTEPYLDHFKHYASLASTLFSCMGKDSSVIDYAWERAVLSKGDYLTTASSYRRNLLSTRRSKNNIERDHSWKRLLRLSLDWDDKWNTKQSYVKAVLDDPDFNVANIQQGLDNICKQSLKSMKFPDWRIPLLEKPELYRLCRQGFIVRNSDKVVLLHQSRRCHYHSELFSRYLYQLLNDEKMDVTPFQCLEYIEVRSGEEIAYIKLSDFNFSEQEYVLEIWFESEKYCFYFYNVEDMPCSTKLEKPLQVADFILGEDWVDCTSNEDWAGCEMHYFYTCKTPQQAQKKLKELCNLLNGIM